MDETSLRAEFDSAVATRPSTPYLVANSVRAGKRLRRRRQIEAAAVSAGMVAVVAVLAPLLSGQFSNASRNGSAAQATVRGQGMAYVLTQINDATSRVTPVRLSTGTAQRPLPVRGVVMALSAAPSGKSVYVFSTPHNYVRNQKNYVTRVNAATSAVGKPVRLRGGLQEIQEVDIGPGSRYAYAIEFGTWPGSKDGTRALVAINLATGAQRALVDPASSFAITPNGRMGFALRLGQDVIPVDLATGTVLAPSKVPGMAMAMAVAPSGTTAYVLSDTRTTSSAHRGREWLTPIDAATGAAAKSIQLPPGIGIQQLAIGDNGRTAYLSGGQSVQPVSLPSGHALKPVRLQPILGDYLYNLVIPPRGTTGFAVPLMTWVQPFDLRTGTAESPVSLPSEYGTGYRTVTAPALDQSGDAFYVGATAYSAANVREDALIPIQMSSREPGQPISVAGLPVQVVIAG